jgi:hypothetical protein
MVQIRHIPLTTVAILFVLCLWADGYGDIIKTGVTAHYGVEGPGEIVIALGITNTGNTTAYNLAATIFLADWADKDDNLGDNPPGGKTYLRWRYHHPGLKPGRYTAVVRVTFEEQSGLTHRVYHVFPLSYRRGPVSLYQPRLSVCLGEPVFNIRAFWGRKAHMRLCMGNGYDEPVRPLVFFYLPEGLKTDEPYRCYELDPGQERRDEIPLVIHRSELQDRKYYLVVSYEHDGIHYSEQLEGKVNVEERHVMFRAYLVFGLGALLVLFATLYLHHRKSSSSLETNRP